MHLLNKDLPILIRISVEFVPNRPFDNEPSLVQEMTWHNRGDTPLREPMMTQFTAVFRSRLASISQWFITIQVISKLTHLPLVPHICDSESGHYRFRWWLVAYSAPSHYLNQCCFIINRVFRNKLQWNFNQNTRFLIHEKYHLRNGDNFAPGEMG